MRHNYPKVRKKRNTDYAKSTFLIKTVGLDKFCEVLSRKGMYLASDELTMVSGQYISPYIIRYVRNKIKNGELNNETITI